MRLVPRGLGVRVANASGTLIGVLTPLRREAITVKASTCSSLSLRGVVPRNARNLPCPTPSLHRANQRTETLACDLLRGRYDDLLNSLVIETD
jgi:hypothetical protein